MRLAARDRTAGWSEVFLTKLVCRVRLGEGRVAVVRVQDITVITRVEEL
jgi:hypothetical protein